MAVSAKLHPKISGREPLEFTQRGDAIGDGVGVFEIQHANGVGSAGGDGQRSSRRAGRINDKDVWSTHIPLSVQGCNTLGRRLLDANRIVKKQALVSQQGKWRLARPCVPSAAPNTCERWCNHLFFAACASTAF